MKKVILGLSFIVLLSTPLCYAGDMKPLDAYKHMSETLNGQWTLSDEDKQIGTKSYKNKVAYPLVGTDTTAMGYKLVGKGSTLQEDLLPDTKKHMVTMYHCNSQKDCTKLKATHYCAKKNQPQLLLSTEETSKNKIVFNCDMSTKLCNSNENHIHKIIHELSNNGKHLKSSFLGWKDQKLNKKNSVYHFDKK